MNKAYKFRIYPNSEQKFIFAKTFGRVIFIYNRMLADKIEYYNKYQKKLNNKHSYTANFVNGNIIIQNGMIKLPKVGFLKMKQHRTIPENSKLKSITISQTPSGKYYVSILFEYENQVQKTEPQKFLGLDFSMSELYAASIALNGRRKYGN